MEKEELTKEDRQIIVNILNQVSVPLKEAERVLEIIEKLKQ